MKVAYYSPMPPAHSGVADYSALLVPALRERVERLEVVKPGASAPRADVHLYHVGNDAGSHGWIVDALARRPGVVVLHEFVLHHLIVGMTIGRGRPRAYLDAMERDSGVAGRLIGLGVLDNVLPRIEETQPERFPLAGTVLDLASQGVIVHSDYVGRLVRASGYAGAVWSIPHPAWPDRAIVPADLGGDPLVGCFGHQNMNKRIPQLLEAFAELRRSRPGARLLLAGESAAGFDLNRQLERAEIDADALICVGYVPEERLLSLMAACDVIVNLRFPTMGETSGAVIRGLSLGKAMVVSKVGWFAELPDDVALKVPVDALEVQTLAAALRVAADQASALGAAARSYVQREHALARVADGYVAALEVAAGGEAVSDAVLTRIAQAAAETGVIDAAELARQVREAGLA